VIEGVAKASLPETRRVVGRWGTGSLAVGFCSAAGGAEPGTEVLVLSEG